MDFFTDNTAPRLAITDFLIAHGNELPDDVRAELRARAASPNIVDAVVRTGELLYAHRDDLPGNGLLLGARLSAYRAANDWYRDADGTSARALAMCYAFMRDADEPPPLGVSYQSEAEDPAVHDDYAIVDHETVALPPAAE